MHSSYFVNSPLLFTANLFPPFEIIVTQLEITPKERKKIVSVYRPVKGSHNVRYVLIKMAS